MAKKSKAERKQRRAERKQHRKEKIKKLKSKVGKYVIPPQLYPFLPLMKRYLDKNGFPYDKKSPRDIVFQFYRRFVKKERNYTDSDYYHINEYLYSFHADGGDKKSVDPVAFAQIASAVLNFLKTIIEKTKKKKQAELAPDERELASDATKVNDDPKSNEIVERAKKEQSDAQIEKRTDDEPEDNFITRILKALGLIRKRKRIRTENCCYIGHIENYSDPVLENDPENPLMLERKRIYHKKTGTFRYVWLSPYLKKTEKSKRKASMLVARQILAGYDIDNLKKDIIQVNTDKLFLKIDSIIREADTKPVMAGIAHILMNRDKIFLLKVLRIFPKDIYSDLYNKILNLKP
jgi:hypothetical protein